MDKQFYFSFDQKQFADINRWKSTGHLDPSKEISGSQIVFIPWEYYSPVVSVSALIWLIRYIHFRNLHFLNDIIILIFIYARHWWP